MPPPAHSLSPRDLHVASRLVSTQGSGHFHRILDFRLPAACFPLSHGVSCPLLNPFALVRFTLMLMVCYPASPPNMPSSFSFSWFGPCSTLLLVCSSAPPCLWKAIPFLSQIPFLLEADHPPEPSLWPFDGSKASPHRSLAINHTLASDMSCSMQLFISSTLVHIPCIYVSSLQVLSEHRAYLWHFFFFLISLSNLLAYQSCPINISGISRLNLPQVSCMFLYNNDL